MISILLPFKKFKIDRIDLTSSGVLTNDKAIMSTSIWTAKAISSESFLLTNGIDTWTLGVLTPFLSLILPLFATSATK